MLDSNVKSYKSLKMILIYIIISVVSGSSAGAFLSFRIPEYWDFGRLTRLGILLATSLIFGIIFFFLLKLAIYIFKRNNAEVNKSTLFIPFLISSAMGLFFLLGDQTHVPNFWMNGWGIYIECVVNLITVLIILPLCLYLVINCFIYLAKSDSAEKSTSQLKPIYQKSFSIIMLVMLITPMILTVPEFKEINTEFWGSEQLRNKYALIRYYLGDKLFQDSIISEGNWLVYSDVASMQDFQNTWAFTEYHINKINAKLSQIDQYLSSQGIKVYIVIPPNKNTIYPEYVPDEIPVIGEVSRYDQMIEILSEYDNITFIDSREILLEARTHTQVYYATDTHWNPYGAYFTYEAIINEINKTYPEITPYSLDDFEEIRLP